MTSHLPALQVVLPLIAAPICFLIRQRTVVRVWATLVAWASFAIALALLSEATRGTISYSMGGWAPPLGIEYRIDLANAYLLVIVTAIASVVLPFGRTGMGLDLAEGREYLFYSAFLLCLTGLLGIAITGDAFNVFVFVEIMSLSSYILISLGKGRRAKKAAFYYLTMGTIGGTFYLLGVGLLYQMTGTLNMADIAKHLPEVLGTRTVLVAFAFVMVGTSIKLAVFPLHQWLPNAYTYAPDNVSAFLAATATKVSYYVLVRVVFTLFGAGFVFGVLRLHWILMPLALAAMFVGSLAAIYQTNIKRLLAYSSIAQVGYMALGLSLHNVNGLAGGMMHLFNHAMMKGGLFLVVACVALRVGTRVDDFRGLGRRMPLTMAAFVIGGLSLIGVPGTVGFVSKWYLVKGALDHGWLAVAIAILLSSLLAVVYIWRIIELAYFEEPPPTPAGKEPVTEVGFSMLVPTWILIGATIVFGLQTDLTAGLATAAASQLLGVVP